MADDKVDGLKMKYFVLKPEGNSDHALASRVAMRAYAESISGSNPTLARELRSWVDKEWQEAKKAEKSKESQLNLMSDIELGQKLVAYLLKVNEPVGRTAETNEKFRELLHEKQRRVAGGWIV